LQKKNILKKIYSNLDPWQKVQVSRHNDRPHTIDYVNNIFDDIIFLHGDKKYADDNAIIGGYSLSDDGHDLVTCCVIDNLLKGAASQCIQNLNITFGFDESLSLEDTFN